MNYKVVFCILVFLAGALVSSAQSQFGGSVKYCDVHIDSVSDGSMTVDSLIQTAMVDSTTIQAVVNAINSGKITIDTAVGCGIDSYNNLDTADFTKPSQLQVFHDWFFNQAIKFDSIRTDCPVGAGRYGASITLGGYYARLANDTDSVSLEVLNIQPQNFLQTQYDSTHATSPLTFAPGVYGYLNVNISNSCYISISGDNDVSNHYTSPSPYQVTYNNGFYAGDSFYVSDYNYAMRWFWGGLSYDQAWITDMMIEAATRQPNSTYKNEYTNSAIESAEWAMQEPPEALSAATANDIWILADMYNWTGNVAFYNNMVDKLNRGLLPSVLTDFIKPGYVDGMNNKSFDSLTLLAQHPGRMWDPGDAVPWNTALCANAVVEAYVACRDRGQDSEALALKPYVNDMLGNICWQINNVGPLALSVLYRDIDYSVINAIWKIEDYEKDPHSNWDSTAWAMYNGGLAKYFGLPTVNIALYLMVVDSVPYQQLTTGIAKPLPDDILQVEAYPNPTDGNSTLKFYITSSAKMAIKVTDITGRIVEQVADEEFSTGQHTLNLDGSKLSDGMYFICLEGNSQTRVIKWVKD